MIKQFKGQYSWLSNFTECKVIYDSMTYPSVENAYQAMKCKNKNDRFLFLNVPSNDAKKLGQKVEVIDDWENVKLKAMNSLLYQKFYSEPFKSLLLETGNKHIIEGNTWGDKFWGICLKTNKGQNNLGILIMNIRRELL